MAKTRTQGNRWPLFLGLVLTAGVAMQGCAPFASPDSQGGSLEEISATDATAGFKDFAAGLGADDGAGTGSIDAGEIDLDDDLVVTIEDLQFDLNRGLISDLEFGTSIQGVIGDEAPTLAFVGFDLAGGPFRFEWTARLTELLSLTEEQVQATDVIFNDLHDAIEALRGEEENSLDDVITDQQRLAVRRRTRSDTVQPDFFARRLAPGQALTAAQASEITPIRTAFRAAVRALHVEAREAFLELLTDDQRKLLDSLERPRIGD